MDVLILFGLFVVAAICYALESRSNWFILAFAGAFALVSIYSFLQGEWPWGIFAAIWAAVAGWRWRNSK
jgi:hypothetical protein